jgi:hypothetical protein
MPHMYHTPVISKKTRQARSERCYLETAAVDERVGDVTLSDPFYVPAGR